MIKVRNLRLPHRLWRLAMRYQGAVIANGVKQSRKTLDYRWIASSPREDEERDILTAKYAKRDGVKTSHCREMQKSIIRLREPCEQRGDPDFSIYYYAFIQIMMIKVRNPGLPHRLWRLAMTGRENPELPHRLWRLVMTGRENAGSPC